MLPQPVIDQDYHFEPPFPIAPITTPDHEPTADLSLFSRNDLWLLYPHGFDFLLESLYMIQSDLLSYVIETFGWFVISDGIVRPTDLYRDDCRLFEAALRNH